MQAIASPSRPAEIWRGNPRYWLIQFGGWGASALVGIAQSVIRPEADMSLAEAAFIVFAYALLCIAATHGLRAWIRWSGFTHRPWKRALLPGIIAVGITSLAIICIVFLLALTRRSWRMEMWGTDLLAEFGAQYASSFILCLGWLLIYCAVQYQRQFQAMFTEEQSAGLAVCELLIVSWISSEKLN
jgi:hypothetical protein